MNMKIMVNPPECELNRKQGIVTVQEKSVVNIETRKTNLTCSGSLVLKSAPHYLQILCVLLPNFKLVFVYRVNMKIIYVLLPITELVFVYKLNMIFREVSLSKSRAVYPESSLLLIIN